MGEEGETATVWSDINGNLDVNMLNAFWVGTAFQKRKEVIIRIMEVSQALILDAKVAGSMSDRNDIENMPLLTETDDDQITYS